MKKICGFNFFILYLLCYVQALTGMDAGNPLSSEQSAVVSVSDYRQEIKKLLVLQNLRQRIL